MRARRRSALRALLITSCLIAPGIALAQAAPPMGQDETALDEIIVTGQRAAQQRALQDKRNADNFVEALSADDAGKLPDQNVGESVRRLPGVSVANDQGEGRYVIIRGVAPSLANVTLNGQTAAAPEPDSRQVKLDDIPSALIGSVSVIKSLTADLDANAIAGQVDIVTLSAFDRSGPFATARLVYGELALNGEHPYEGDATIGGRFGLDDQFGFVLSANYSHRPIRSENLQGSSNWTTLNGYQVPDDFRIREYNLIRERQGAVINLDWRPTDALSLYVRSTYSNFTDNETRDQFRIEIPVATAGAITGQTATTGSFTRGRGTRFVRRREEDDTTFTVTLGGTLDIGDASELSGQLSFTRAEKDDPLRSEWQFRSSATAFPGTYDVSENLYTVTAGPAAYLAATYPARSVNYDVRNAVENLTQARIDYETPLSMFEDATVKVGLKIIDRDKKNERDIRAFTAAGFTLASAAYMDGTSVFDGRYPFGPRVSYDLAQAYVAANPTALTFDQAGSVGNSLVNDYEANEQITAGYMMATAHFGDLTVIPGLRVEHTEADYRAKSFTLASTLTQGFNIEASRQYTDYFPGVNVKWEPTETLVVRGAITTAIGRPNYYDVIPTTSVDSGAGTVALGNPDLEALRSVNFDAAVEWYLTRDSIISVGLFNKQIDNPIYTSTRTVVGGTFAGQVLPTAQVTQPLNADKAEVTGLELNIQTQFTFLSSPFDGLGVSANYTWIESEASGLAGQSRTVPLFNQSPRVASAQLFYEKYGITARLAYSFRDRFLDTVGATANNDLYTDALGQFDARLSYDIRDEVTIFVEGSNLNDARFRRFQSEQRPYQTVEEERYGRSVRAGVSLKF
ncbi:TonB-dependent receptor [Brevundimonas sp.]|uniref:TonB-dependent receptor n=1 Tax=Brevundimonas sp. TaxID=1871086 RepID=UPI003D144556